jgi:hypothetical protein
MQTSADEPQRSGSRWEPVADEQPTEVLTPPAAATVAPASVRRRAGIPTVAAVLIAVLVGVLGGAVAGFAIAGGGDEQPASSVESGQQGPGGAGQLPGDGQLGGPGQGRHGFGDHEGEYR